MHREADKALAYRAARRRRYEAQRVPPAAGSRMRASRRGRARRTPPREILPSRTLAPARAARVYAGMYFVRLHDASASDYPVVRQILGAAAFEKLARAYVTKFPSRATRSTTSATNLPEFLASKNVRVPRRALLRDVARLELAMAGVFDAEPSPELDAEGARGDPGRGVGSRAPRPGTRSRSSRSTTR